MTFYFNYSENISQKCTHFSLHSVHLVKALSFLIWIVKSEQANVASLRFLFDKYSGFGKQRLVMFYSRCILWFVLRALQLSLR